MDDQGKLNRSKRAPRSEHK